MLAVIGVLAVLVAAPTSVSAVGAVAAAPAAASVQEAPAAASVPSESAAAAMPVAAATPAEGVSAATAATASGSGSPGLALAGADDIAGCGTACSGISASPRELAQWLLDARDQGRFQVDSSIDEIWANEIAPIANGTVQAKCDIDGRVLQLLVVSIKSFGTVKVNDLNRWCANDGEYNCTGEFHPPSPWHCRIPAVAVDFGRVGNQRTSGWGDGSNGLIALMNQFMPANTHLGQQGCFGRPSMRSLGYNNLTNEFADTCNHLHVDIGTASGGLKVAAAGGLPIGSFDSAFAQPGGLQVNGWAVDLDTTQPVRVNVTVDGRLQTSTTADASRPDVAAAIPGIGASHGFSVSVPASAGAHEVCVLAVDADGGGSSQLGCTTVSAMSGAPFGTLDSADRTGLTAKVAGWAIDPDTKDPISVAVTVNGANAGTATANIGRGDVGSAYPGYGTAHGYTTSVALSPGDNRICTYGLDSSSGARGPALGCSTVTVPTDPFGNFEAATASIVTATLSGWVVDPDSVKSPVDVHVYVNGTYQTGAWGGSFSASGNRSDVGAAYPDYGARHGFSITLPVTPGTTQYCLYAINLGPGNNTSLGCRTVSTPTGSPVGNFEAATLSNGQVSLQGWVLDPDTAASIQVHVYVNGTKSGAYSADAPRADVGSAYSGYGDKHGISVSGIAVPVGTSDVCVYGIDRVGGQQNTMIGCRTVSSASGPPKGTIDSAIAGVGTVRVSGWALDPDTPAPIDVHVYVDGRWGGAVTAGSSRPDIASAFPGYGAAHGFTLTLAAGPGTHQVCAYGINVRAGSNPQLACSMVQVPGGDPFGNVDKVSVADGKVTLEGWAIDPDTDAPVQVHVYVGSAWGGLATASRSRADVAKAFPLYGSGHGFAITVPIPIGTSQVCAYAINQGAGTTNPQLGCTTVVR